MNQETGARNQETGARNQETGPGTRSQEPGAGNQETERETRAEGFFSADVCSSTAAAQLAKKVECAGATCRAPVGVIYGASILP